MQITSGLFDHIVLQRNRRDVSDAAFGGTASANGSLTATVRKSGRALKGWADVSLGAVKGKKFQARLKDLPAGGPYDITLRVIDADGSAADELNVTDVLVGDVWLLGGQSNMQGCGLLKDGPKPEAMVRAFYMDDRWAPAKEPIHNMWKTVDQVHIDLSGGVRPPKNDGWGVGPGVAFGQSMREMTGVPQGVIACAHGGTAMAQWDPAMKKAGTKSLYGAMIRRFIKNGSKVAGLIWYQGCSDADEAAAALYTRRMKALIRATRCDCGKNLPVATVQISRVMCVPLEASHAWNSIQDQQRLLQGVIDNLVTVPAIDLSLDDAIHISGRDQVRLGQRLAQAMGSLTMGRKAGKRPIELGNISITQSRGSANVIVEFDNVMGSLRSGDRPVGFTIGGTGPESHVYDVELKGRRAIIHSTLPEESISGKCLWYGRGTDPVCNITDEAGRSLPVFGPIPIGAPRAITSPIRTLSVSKFLPGADKLNKVEYPKDIKALKLKRRTFPLEFCCVHEEAAPWIDQDPYVFYSCRIKCSEAMRLLAILGYDGPVKMWVDGRKRHTDLKGTNPANPCDAVVPFRVDAGEHEILVALGLNGGWAWGIYLRLERLDVPKRLLKEGPASYAMPAILG